jgi:hypothetical protein
VVNQLLQGKSNKFIASSLGISIRTVEFHLKNIYAKYQVGSRIELVLKLANTSWREQNGKLGDSTVAGMAKKIENGAGHKPETHWAPPFGLTVSMIDKESGMNNLLFTKHVLAGLIAAFLTGLMWVAVMQHFGHMSLNSILPWILPLGIVMALIGASLGAFGKRNHNSLLKIFISAIFGTGLGAFAMLPLVAAVVYPLGKLAERLGLINRAAIPTDVTSTLVIVSMLALWLIVGTAVGILALHVRLSRTNPPALPLPASEHSL